MFSTAAISAVAAPGYSSGEAMAMCIRDRSTADHYKQSDLLVAYKSITKAEDATKYTALSLDLKQALAKLTIEVNAKAIEDAVINLVTIKDAVADYTVTYNSTCLLYTSYGPLSS